jgi:hypothetical protein
MGFIASSAVENAAFSLRPFLISSQVACGCSLYSRKARPLVFAEELNDFAAGLVALSFYIVMDTTPKHFA